MKDTRQFGGRFAVFTHVTITTRMASMGYKIQQAATGVG